MLRNGNLLRGKITETSDGFLVEVDLGRIRVPADEVDFRCRTLKEAYERWKSRIEPGDVRAHLELAAWCQRYGLLGLAAQELDQVRALAPEHPMIPLLRRRIEMGASCRPERAEPPDKPRDRPPPPKELDRLVREMPPGTMERFTREIQPLLVNRCSATACHGPASEQDFRLLRIPSGRPASRRLTQRNLHSALELIDRDDPAKSKLLTVPAEAHGSAEAPFGKGRQDQYWRLADWVFQVAEKTHGTPAVAAKTPQRESPAQVPPRMQATSAAHTAPVEPGARSGSPVVSAAWPAGAPSSAPSVPSAPSARGKAVADREGGVVVSGSMVVGGKPAAGAASADPFDPGAFNRRFFPERAAPKRKETHAWDEFIDRQQGAAPPVASPGNPPPPGNPPTGAEPPSPGPVK